MEAQGVEILTCGTCLNFYGLTDKLAVGGVTNMYTIVEKLALQRPEHGIMLKIRAYGLVPFAYDA